MYLPTKIHDGLAWRDTGDMFRSQYFAHVEGPLCPRGDYAELLYKYKDQPPEALHGDHIIGAGDGDLWCSRCQEKFTFPERKTVKAERDEVKAIMNGDRTAQPKLYLFYRGGSPRDQ